MPATSSGSRSVGVAMLIAVSILWSLAGLSVKTAKMNPMAFAFYRCVAAAIPMAVLALFSVGRRPTAGWMSLSAVVYTLVVTPFIAAMTLGTAASGILLQYTSPAFCALFAWLFFSKRIDRRTLLAIIIATAGVGIMLAFDRIGQSLLGPSLGLLSGVAFGALPLVLSQLDRRCDGRANPFLIVLFNNLGAAVILLPICLYYRVLDVRAWQLALVAATGAFQLALPYVLFQLALRRVSPVDSALLILFEPVLNPVWVYLFVGESPGRGTLIGGIAILAALVIEATKAKDLPDNRQ
ncbi:MAG: DMT family transporter [Planctomycetota bacterium]|nr:DMT family transporter [Planctomycetota bacterium]